MTTKDIEKIMGVTTLAPEKELKSDKEILSCIEKALNQKAAFEITFPPEEKQGKKASTFEVMSYDEEYGWITHASCTTREKAEKAVKLLKTDDETDSISYDIIEDDSIDTVRTSDGLITL